MSYTKEEYLELVNSGLVVGSAVEGYEVGYAACAGQLAEANKKLADAEQRGYDRCVAFHNSIVGTIDGSDVDLLAKAKEEGRAEAQARIKVLEAVPDKLRNFIQSLIDDVECECDKSVDHHCKRCQIEEMLAAAPTPEKKG